MVHVDRFYEEAEKHGRYLRKEDLLVSVQDLPDTTPGLCAYGGINHIYIGKKFFEHNYNNFFSSGDSVYFEKIQYVIFHELGHCVLHRSHTNNYSIMRPVATDYNINNFLLHELFNF
jgi:hypothetical protein